MKPNTSRKAKISKSEILAAGNACKAIFWSPPAPRQVNLAWWLKPMKKEHPVLTYTLKEEHPFLTKISKQQQQPHTHKKTGLNQALS